MFENPGTQTCRAMLKRVKNIAVAGLSTDADRPSYSVSAAMQGIGFRVIPVHPVATEILGEKAYSSHGAVPALTELVNVFRSAEFIDGVVDECLNLSRKSLWIQEGIFNEAVAERVRSSGMAAVKGRCLCRVYCDYCR